MSPNAVAQDIIAARKIHAAQAYEIMDRLIAAKDAVTCLLPLHVKTAEGKLVAIDHIASGFDMGRTTAGLVMISQLARAENDPIREGKYLTTAEENYARGKALLLEQDYFVHRRDFHDEGIPTRTDFGEPGKSELGEDTCLA